MRVWEERIHNDWESHPKGMCVCVCVCACVNYVRACNAVVGHGCSLVQYVFSSRAMYGHVLIIQKSEVSLSLSLGVIWHHLRERGVGGDFRICDGPELNLNRQRTFTFRGGRVES